MLNDNQLLSIVYKILPEQILNNHSYSLNKFISKAAKICNKRDEKIIDIGAGECPYVKLFDKCRYLSQDIINNKNTSIDYVCDAKRIPVKDNSFDYIICTQVLEHVNEPHLVIKEMFRILKKGGKVFLTVPMCAEEHMLPYDYFRYTRYGLEYLATANGFKVKNITPQGGRFIVLGKQIQTAIPRILTNKYLIYFYYFFALIPIFLIHLICFYLDKLDRQKLLTLNYECVFAK